MTGGVYTTSDDGLACLNRRSKLSWIFSAVTGPHSRGITYGINVRAITGAHFKHGRDFVAVDQKAATDNRLREFHRAQPANPEPPRNLLPAREVERHHPGLR